MPRKKTVVVSPAAKSEKYAEVFELEAASHFGAEFVADWAAALGEPEDVIEAACQNAIDSVLPALAVESQPTLSQAATVFRRIVLGDHGKERSTRQIGLLELNAGLDEAINQLTPISDLDFGPETKSPFDLRRSEDDLPNIFIAIPEGEELSCSETDAKQAVLDAHVPLSTRDLLLLLQQVRDLHKKLEAVARQLPKPKLGAKANHIAHRLSLRFARYCRTSDLEHLGKPVTAMHMVCTWSSSRLS